MLESKDFILLFNTKLTFLNNQSNNTLLVSLIHVFNFYLANSYLIFKYLINNKLNQI